MRIMLLLLAPVLSMAGIDRFDDYLKANMGKISNEDVTVIVSFKDKIQVPKGFQTSNNHGRVEKMMRELNQKNMSGLKTFMESSNASLAVKKVQALWINNGAIMRLRGSALHALGNAPNVAKIYHNGVVKLIGPKVTPGRPRDAADPFTYGLTKIQVPELRSKFPEVQGKGVLVGIIDSGIDDKHPDLAGRTVVWKDFTDEASNTPGDDNGHGTHVAGTISGGNASGTAIGVAPDVKLVIGRIFDASGGTSWATALSAMQWMADPDGNPATNDFPSVVSNSWGGGAPDADEDPAENSLCVALGGWVKLGMLPVFAAGNSGPRSPSVGLPGGCPEAFAIGATDIKDSIASFSSRGPAVWKTGSFLKPNVSAPGVGVISSIPGGKYAAFSGTSMATPHTAGVAALLYQVAPKAPPAAIVEAIAKSSLDLGKPGDDMDFGAGRINALEAVLRLKKMMRQ